jgi:hypothetical protein
MGLLPNLVYSGPSTGAFFPVVVCTTLVGLVVIRTYVDRRVFFAVYTRQEVVSPWWCTADISSEKLRISKRRRTGPKAVVKLRESCVWRVRSLFNPLN